MSQSPKKFVFPDYKKRLWRHTDVHVCLPRICFEADDSNSLVISPGPNGVFLSATNSANSSTIGITLNTAHQGI